MSVKELLMAVSCTKFNGWLDKAGTPCIFVCFQHPYFHKHFAALADTVINTYGVTDENYPALLRLLFGEC